MKKLIVSCMICVLYGCNGQKADIESTIDYINSKKDFEKELVDHFPERTITVPHTIINSKNVEKNDVCFMLYEYQVSSSVKDTLINFLNKKKTIKYSSNDNCLLIVNRFETIETSENRLSVEIKDSSKIEKPCYYNLLPIPNFIDYSNPIAENDLKLEADFDIYVLEAKSGNYFKEFKLAPNPQMPKEWHNGYSKGISIGKQKNTIIYWSIIW